VGDDVKGHVMGEHRSRQQASRGWMHDRAHFLWTVLVILGVALAVALALVTLHMMDGTTVPEKF
jgi:hypothetical protein